MTTILEERERDGFRNRWFQGRKRRDLSRLPKSAKRFADKRIIGIDWALVRE